MIEIVELKNPFDKLSREITTVEYVPGKSLIDYIEATEVEFVLNGNLVDQPEITYPVDHDQVIVMAHVGSGALKSILGTIASMMLMGFAGSIVKGGLFGIVGKTLGAYLAAGAVMYIGGRIINTVFTPQNKGLDTSGDQSRTYGWDMPVPITGEGGVIGITYG